MQGHSQAIFYLEDLSPTWLTTDKQRQAWESTVVISITLLSGPSIGLGVDLGIMLGVDLGVDLGGDSFLDPGGKLVLDPGGRLLVELVRGLIGGMGFGMLLGIGFGLGDKDRDTMKPVEGFAWSWVTVLERLRSRVMLGLTLWLGIWLGVGQFGGLIGGLVLGLIGVLGGVVYDGLQGKSDNVESRLTPNHGVWKSARNAPIGGLIGGLFGGMGGGLSGGLVSGLIGGLVGGLGFGLVGGLLGALHYGGYVCIRHAVLRLFLWRKGYIPLNYVCFLDEAADRILLRKVGGGYTFIHRMLLDYFASQYNA